MNVQRCEHLPEVLIIERPVFPDDRGYFMELYRVNAYAKLGVSQPFVQDNLSYSGRNVLRGLHYQVGRPQGKLISVAFGEIFDVAVDIRRGSPRFGQWTGLPLSAAGGRQLYIPAGFAHGFCVLSEAAIVSYKCTDYYAQEGDRGLRWDDPAVGIRWPVSEPSISEKDRRLPLLSETALSDLPSYRGEVQ